MAQEKLDLPQVCRRYKIRVIRTTPEDGFYLLETNKGPKELRIWPKLDILRWSYAWRERMARQGWRDVERFIRTRDAKPYVVWGKIGCTLTDHLRQAEPLSLTTDALRRCGRAVARMHQAQRFHRLPFAPEVWKRHLTQVETEVQRVRSFYDSLRGRHPRDEGWDWLLPQLPPLLERMEKAARLLLRGAPADDDVDLSHVGLSRENWRMLDDRLILVGFYRSALAVQQRDTASFLRELYEESGGEQAGLEAVDAFLDGYEEEGELRRDHYTRLLAFLVYPKELWKQVEQALSHSSPLSRETLQQLERLIRAQQRMDTLLAHVARRAERTAKG